MLFRTSGKDVLLMFGDIKVMSMNFLHGRFEVLNGKYMPYGLRDRIISNGKINEYTDMEFERQLRMSRENETLILQWFSRRALSLSRANADKIYAILRMEREENIYDKFDFVTTCRAVSVLDKYWVRYEDEDIAWDSINVKHNHLSEVIGHVALHGSQATLEGSFNSPEITTNGLFAKAWRRRNDGNLWLYKTGRCGDIESQIEVEVSRVLDKCNVSHVRYEEGMDSGRYVCMCKCISTDEYSIVSAAEFKEYCDYHMLDFEEEVLKIDSEGYYKMHIVDYLISNNDRHRNNWGFYMDNSTMKLISLHPLFDHNDSFQYDCMNNENIEYRCTGRSMLRDAKYAMRKVDFHFIKDIVSDDFDWDEHYASFVKRAKRIGVKTVTNIGDNPFIIAANKMGN